MTLKDEIKRKLSAANEQQLARISEMLSDRPPEAVMSTQDSYRLVRPLLGGENEALVVAALNRRMKPIETARLTLGSSAFTVVDTAQILRWVLTRRKPAFGFILAHNHPSGDPTPSQQDWEVTRYVARGACAVNIRFIDHLVLTDTDDFSSLRALDPNVFQTLTPQPSYTI